MNNIYSRKISWGLARQIVVRDGYRCRHCNFKLTLNHIVFDHIVPLSKGGKTILDNLIVSCYSCNQRKGDTVESPKYPPQLIHVEMVEKFQHIPNVNI